MSAAGQQTDSGSICAAGHSAHPNAAAAVGEVVGDVLNRIDAHPDLVVLFAAGRFVDELDSVAAAVNTLLAPGLLIGSDVPRVFGGTDDRAADDGLLLLAAHLDTDTSITPIRFDPDAADAGWHSPDGATVDEDGLTLVLSEPTAPVAEIPGHVVGIGGSSGRGLVLDEYRYGHGAVGAHFPPGLAKPIDFVLPLWEDVVPEQPIDDGLPPTAEPTPVDEPLFEPQGALFDPGAGAGLLLFAARGAAAPMGARFDFEIAFDRFHGAVAGALAPVVWSPSPPERIDQRGRAICGLVFR